MHYISSILTLEMLVITRPVKWTAKYHSQCMAGLHKEPSALFPVNTFANVEQLFEQHLRKCPLEIQLMASVYLRFQGASTSQVIGARNEWVWMIMMAKWYSGTWGPKASRRHLSYRCLTGEENLARCVTGAHATAWPTAVDNYYVLCKIYFSKEKELIGYFC